MLLLLAGTLLRHFKEHFLENLFFISAEKKSHLGASTLSCESTLWICKLVLRQACPLESVLGKTVNSVELRMCHMNRGGRYDFWKRPQGGDALVPSEASFKFLYLICLILIMVLQTLCYYILLLLSFFLSFFSMEEQRPFGSISPHTVFTEELVYLRICYMCACCFQKSCSQL